MSNELIDKLQKIVGPPTLLELVYSFCTYVSTAATWMMLLYAIALGFTFSIVGEVNYRLAVSFVAAGIIFADAVRWLISRRLRRIRNDDQDDED